VDDEDDEDEDDEELDEDEDDPEECLLAFSCASFSCIFFSLVSFVSKAVGYNNSTSLGAIGRNLLSQSTDGKGSRELS